MAAIEFGIDLGTTNSAVAHRRGAQAHVVKNTQTHSDLTPSAVYIHKSGRVFVGQRALNRQAQAAHDVATEFKRLMGRPEPFVFAKAGRSMRAEDLSAEVLKSLQADVQKTLGQRIDAAAVTIPAAFEVPQRHATHDAASLAGIDRIVLLHEPIAAAIGYGFHTEDQDAIWLTFDLGGGTFDVAVVEVREGIMEVRGHMGDNHRGGKDCDWAIVDNILVPYLSQRFNVSGFDRSDEQWETLAWRLKRVAEDAKIALSTAQSYPLTCEDGYLGKDNDGREMDLELDLAREDYEQLVEPFFARAIDLTKKLLKQQRLSASDISRLVLVGGPTMTPLLRDMISDQLSLQCEAAVDPMTVVATGAAIFGGTQVAQDEVGTSPTSPPLDGKPQDVALVKLTYKPVTNEREAPVLGEVVQCPADAVLEIEREDGGWSSGRIPLTDGKFATSVTVEPHSANTYFLRLWTQDGAALPVQPGAFEVTHGVALGAAPLPHSLGIGLEDGTVVRVINRNARLPARRTIHGCARLTKTVEAGSDSSAVFPILEGDSDSSGRNIPIGWFEIRGSELKRTLYVRTTLDVTFECDENGMLRVTVTTDLLSEPLVVEYNARYPELSRDVPERLDRRVKGASATFSRLKGAVSELGEDAPELDAILHGRMAEEAERAVKACRSKKMTPSSRDEAMKAHDVLAEIEELENRLERRLEVPMLKEECRWAMDAARVVADTAGATEDQQYVSSVAEQLETAVREEDWKEARRQCDKLEQKRHELLRDDLEYLENTLAWFAANISTLKDPMMAQQFLNEGAEAIRMGTAEGAQMAIAQLVGLLPSEQSEQHLDYLSSDLRHNL